VLLLAGCHRAGTPAGGDGGSVPVTDGSPGGPPPGTAGHALRTVFVIVMENHDWRDIEGSPSAPYLNGLLEQGAHATQYFNPPGLHPSEPNYLWIEGGQSFNVRDDADPARNHQASTAHLVNLLEQAGLDWKSYQEDIDGTTCPLTRVARYAPKHNPFVYFDDVTDTNSPTAARCLAHVRPYGELAGDLASGDVAAYNFLTPNLCNDMHDTLGCESGDSVRNGDAWLARELPAILASDAYQRGGVVFITWDEGEGDDGPIGLIALSPLAKAGFASAEHHTHSDLLRTLQEIFGVGPYLGFAADSDDLSELFRTFP
jgi:hypothetical protein